jgi:hypothetical protein
MAEMIENLKRIREPLAWAVIVLVTAYLVLGIVQLVVQLQQAVPVFEAFQAIGSSLMNISLVIAVVALVCTCFFIAPATRHAHAVTLVAAIVLSTGVLLTAVCTVLGVVAAGNAFGVVLEIVGGLLDLLLKAIAAGALWVLLRGVRAGRIDTAPPAVPAAIEPVPAGPPDSPELRTTWQRGEASGAVWRTADEAASGAPGATRMPSAGTPGIFRDQADSASAPAPEAADGP